MEKEDRGNFNSEGQLDREEEKRYIIIILLFYYIRLMKNMDGRHPATRPRDQNTKQSKYKTIKIQNMQGR